MTVMPLNRRALLRSAVLLAASSACGRGAWSETAPALPAAKEPPADAAMAVSQAAFAFSLASAIGPDTGSNIVVSPASAAMALAVVALFADKPLTQSIFQVLALEPQRGQQALEKLRHAGQAADAGPLAAANSLALDASLAPSQHLLERLKKADVKLFADQTLNEAALAHINSWVAEVTHGRIPAILDTMPDGAMLIALNALHFKDRWQTAFDPAKTAPLPFRRVDGSSVEKKFMQSGPRSASFRTDDRFIAAQLPFATDRYGLTLITTKGEPAPLQDFKPVASWLSGEGFAQHEGQIALPPLALSGQLDLKPALNALGLKDDGFTGFSGRPPSIRAIAQRVDFSADENGAEAAAATAVTASRSIETRFTNFVADRPFLFALNDRATGLILMSGYIANP